ncbi:serine/threonine-protein kinase [Kineobactrum sediminis]|uniref:serine/threonine-protein kinase n=1 Tax=Kineobactrum sediminis TaxID=1905677 RepID=UPI00138FC1F0|nr:serine/threonine-protein kinase [Kineobactrum sediminis]
MAIEDRVGPYRILRLLRRGGQGSVFLGYDDRLQRRIAVKIYPLPADRAQRKQVLREAQLVAAIDSPRIVKVHDVIVGDEHLAMVMEYIPGCDLEELLDQGDLSLASIVSIATEITAAIALVRQQRIVHGDLKPSNVLVAPDGHIRLTDFGIAGNQGNSHRSGGSPSCVSPEQLKGLPLDVRSDLFALGCLLFRMLAGWHPFMRNGIVDNQAISKIAAPPLPATLADGTPLPEDLVTLVAQLLAKDPAERPHNTHEVRRRLHDIAAQAPRRLHYPLGDEARAAFREEAATEQPLQIPAGLRNQGRSRMPLRAGQWALFGVGRDWRRRHWLVGGGAVLTCLGLLLVALWPRAHRVHVPMPQLAISAASPLPADRVDPWLLEQVRDLSLQVAPTLVFTGEAPGFRSTTLDNSLEALRRPPPPEQLLISLSCQQALCVLGLERRAENWQRYRQVLLVPDAPAAHWHELIALAVNELYGGGH